jgi:uncharacterized membrane protein
MLATVDAYNISLFLHISAVVIGFGATYAEAILFPVAMKVDKRHLPYVHRAGMAINQRLATPALLIVLLTGFYQVAEGNWSLGEFWISATLAIVIVIAVINFAYFIPTDRKLLALVTTELAAAGDGPVTLSDEFNRRSMREGIVGTLVGVLLIVAIFLMVVKPG